MNKRIDILTKTIFNYLLIIIFNGFVLTTMTAQVVQNGDFENWNGTNPEKPNDWITTPVSSGFNIPFVSKSTDAYSGNYALQMIPDSNAFTGIFATSVGQLFHISNSYDSLTGYYKLNNNQGDVLTVRCNFFKNGSFVGGNGGTNLPTVAQYTRFAIPFIISVPDADSVTIVFQLEDAGTTAHPHSGTIALIDKIELTNAGTTGIENNINPIVQNTVKVMPNPASNIVTIATGRTAQSWTGKITNLQGTVVKTIEAENKNTVTIDIQELSKGIYFVEAYTPEQYIGISKLIVQ